VTAGVRVRVLLFARLAEVAGTRQRIVDLQRGARARDACLALQSHAPELAQLLPFARLARNGQLVSLDHQLSDGDELALLPPVGGG
jgi:molybdopterin converting factor small subunit